MLPKWLVNFMRFYDVFVVSSWKAKTTTRNLPAEAWAINISTCAKLYKPLLKDITKALISSKSHLGGKLNCIQKTVLCLNELGRDAYLCSIIMFIKDWAYTEDGTNWQGIMCQSLGLHYYYSCSLHQDLRYLSTNAAYTSSKFVTFIYIKERRAIQQLIKL